MAGAWRSAEGVRSSRQSRLQHLGSSRSSAGSPPSVGTCCVHTRGVAQGHEFLKLLVYTLSYCLPERSSHFSFTPEVPVFLFLWSEKK